MVWARVKVSSGQILFAKTLFVPPYLYAVGHTPTGRPPSLVWRLGRGQMPPKLSLTTIHEPATLRTVITAGITKMNPYHTSSFIVMILELFISQLAYRLHTMLGSSVPSERVFSAMKLTHSRLCATLTTERVDKLLYIQVNCRVLRRPLHAIKKQADEEEDIIMDLEVQRSTGGTWLKAR